MSRGATPANPAVPMLVPEGAHAGQRPMTLNRVFTMIGSAPQARLYLPSKSISRCHAVVVNTPRGLFIRDLASRTGTIVNGRPVREHDLREGDVVQVGTYTFRYTDPTRGIGRAEIPGGGPPPAALEIEGLDEPVELESRVLLIGRRETCDISLTENSASSAHALILEANGRHVLRDLNSRTGTRVNGTPVHEHHLAPGDWIKVGDTKMRYVTRKRSAASAQSASAAPPEMIPLALRDDGVGEAGPLASEPQQPPVTESAEGEVFHEVRGPGSEPESEPQPEPELVPELELSRGPVAGPHQAAYSPTITPEPDVPGRGAEEKFDLLEPPVPELENGSTEPPPAATSAGGFSGAAAAGGATPPSPEEAEPTLEDIVDALRRNLARDEPSESVAPQATEEELLGLSPRDEKAAGRIAMDPMSATHYPSSADTLPRAAAPTPTPAAGSPARAPAAPPAVPPSPPPVAAPASPERKVAQPPRRDPTAARPPASKAPAPAPSRPAATSPATSLPLPQPPPGLTRPVDGPRRTAADAGTTKGAQTKKAARTQSPRPVRPRDPLSLGSDPVDLDLLAEGKQSDNGNHSSEPSTRPRLSGKDKHPPKK